MRMDWTEYTLHRGINFHPQWEGGLGIYTSTGILHVLNTLNSDHRDVRELSHSSPFVDERLQCHSLKSQSFTSQRSGGSLAGHSTHILLVRLTGLEHCVSERRCS